MMRSLFPLLSLGIAASPGLAVPPDAASGDLTALERTLAAKECGASESARSLQAPNRAHGLRSDFAPTGVRVFDRTAEERKALVSLSLAHLGRGDVLERGAAGRRESRGFLLPEPGLLALAAGGLLVTTLGRRSRVQPNVRQ